VTSVSKVDEMPKSRKLKIAVTGSIGSGKSTFIRFIKNEGCPVISADDISKDILLNKESVRKKVSDEFGNEVYSGDGINKRLLAEKIFSDTENLKKINSILHPPVRSKIENLANELFQKHQLVFIEAAIIFESGSEKMYDYVVLISCDEVLREKRILESKKFSKEDFKKRNDAQLDEETKINKADFVFYNDGTKEELKQKALLLIDILNSMIN
jgi:dephospho-CoA kinase